MRGAVWVALTAVCASGCSDGVWLSFAAVRPPIRVGLLHSKTGSMRISEESMVEAEILALEQINREGGLLGRPVEWFVADGRSDPETFAREAERLIRDAKVAVVIGCWSSTCRKRVVPVVEREKHLLLYPVAYEGLEQSPNVVYTGAAPNQQIIPTVTWCSRELKAKTFYVVGSDSVWSRSVGAIIRDELKAIGAKSAGEEYLGETAAAGDYNAAAGRAVAAKADVLLNCLEGESNIPFYLALRAAKATPTTLPVVNFAIAEDEFRKFPAGVLTGDYAVCNYFQAIATPENEAFVRAFKARYGADRVTSDSIATAYNSVRLWAQAVREAGVAEVRDVLPLLLHQSLNAPEGVISVDRESRHTWRPFFVGKIRGDGQVDVVYSLVKAIRPGPFPFSRSRAEWLTFLGTLKTAGRGG